MGVASSGFDGVAVTSTALNAPKGIWKDSAGYVFIAETNGKHVRKVLLDGTMTTIAGNGDAYTAGTTTPVQMGAGGPATSAILGAPEQIFIDSSRRLYVCDRTVALLRRIDLSSGILTAIAGSMDSATSSIGTGAATSLPLGFLSGVAMDSVGT
eukprot:gene6248-7960_t